MASHFTTYNRTDILSITHKRKFETKLGEMAQTANGVEIEEAIAQTSAPYILIGVPEDIGVKANGGIGGTDSCWFSFLDSFLNIQSNDFLRGDQIFIAGHFDFSKVKNLINANAATVEEKMIAYRHAVNMIDDEVENIVKIVTESKKIPIIIGGGHNNAYPAIKGSAKGLFKAEVLQLAQINCINLDTHADYRPLEGRHSGNAFRYADEDGYLKKYCILCIHENYLQQNTWMDIIESPFIDCVTYEDIFLHEKKNFIQAVTYATGYTEDEYTGIELDMDAIENVLSSAATPCGITALHARQFMNFVATDSRVAYVHICEGAAKLENGETNNETGKLISYLVSDFVKAHSGR
ncbi:MAG: arginase family protein [Bacteroidota bacterium]|nr:arginase family protein [Bacteroidota bacterium]